MRKIIALLILLLSAVPTSFAHPAVLEPDVSTVTFRFQQGEDLFILKGNEAELKRLYTLVDKYRIQIADKNMPVYVDSYCASLPTERENLNMAFVRANRVKAELITHKGLKEADFITANYAHAYHNVKDMVVVTLRIPSKTGQQPESEIPVITEQLQPETFIVKETDPQPEPEKQAGTIIATEAESMPSVLLSEPYHFALRTNLLYDAFLLPVLGVEWRINNHFGIKLDGSLSSWGSKNDKVQKIWLLNPEVRWYLLSNRCFYLGISGNYGEYNVYKYPFGSLLSKDTGYQGRMWSAGLTVGYQLCPSRHFSVDFNLGLGYTRSEYDSFNIKEGVRVYKERNRKKNFWGPTQAGISLMWTFGKSK